MVAVAFPMMGGIAGVSAQQEYRTDGDGQDTGWQGGSSDHAGTAMAMTVAVTSGNGVASTDPTDGAISDAGGDGPAERCSYGAFQEDKRTGDGEIDTRANTMSVAGREQGSWCANVRMNNCRDQRNERRIITGWR